jgi:hypothetical protein
MFKGNDLNLKVYFETFILLKYVGVFLFDLFRDHTGVQSGYTVSVQIML